MHNAVWCEHLEKRSKITVVDYRCTDRSARLKIQSWYCPECGVHGAATEIVPDETETILMPAINESESTEIAAT